MTGIERIAKRNIVEACNYIIGGYYNCLLDGYLDDIPNNQSDVEYEIYCSALSDLYFPGGFQEGRAPLEMRFAGKKFCEEVISDYMKSDSDVKEIAEAKSW